MSDRGVRWELQNHDNVLLSLVCEHQRTLQEEILLSAHNKNPNTREKKTWGGEKKTGQEKEDWIKTHKIQQQLQWKANAIIVDRLVETTILGRKTFMHY